jgi:hypothetical protein
MSDEPFGLISVFSQASPRLGVPLSEHGRALRWIGRELPVSVDATTKRGRFQPQPPALGDCSLGVPVELIHPRADFIQ